MSLRLLETGLGFLLLGKGLLVTGLDRSNVGCASDVALGRWVSTPCFFAFSRWIRAQIACTCGVKGKGFQRAVGWGRVERIWV
ncbi:MAG: hypothetical protein ACUVRV_02375 [Cyanobacteriota bacterium]